MGAALDDTSTVDDEDHVGLAHGGEPVGNDKDRPVGGQVLERLLDEADVLVENFKPGLMQRFGLDYDRAHGRPRR